MTVKILNRSVGRLDRKFPGGGQGLMPPSTGKRFRNVTIGNNQIVLYSHVLRDENNFEK
jgi:hypothetical protein